MLAQLGTRRLLILLGALALVVASVWLFVDQELTIVRAKKYNPKDVFNVSSKLKSEQIRWLEAQAKKQEVDLVLLTEREKAEQEAVAQKVSELLDAHERLDGERRELEANQTRLTAEVEELQAVKDRIAGLLREKQSLLADEEQLKADEGEFEAAKAALAKSQEGFAAQVQKLAQDQEILDEKVRRLRAQHKTVKALGRELKHQSGASQLPTEVVDGLDLYGGPSGTTSEASLGEDSLRSVSTTERREFGELLQLAHGQERLNATLSHILNEKNALRVRLGRAVDALRDIAAAKEVECARVADEALVRAPMDDKDLAREWRKRCRPLPFADACASFKCDQLWRRRLAASRVASVHGAARASGAAGGSSLMLAVGGDAFAVFSSCAPPGTSGASWQSGALAFHLDRVLRFHRTPPVTGRVFSRGELLAAASATVPAGTAPGAGGQQSPRQAVEGYLAQDACRGTGDGFLVGAVTGWSSTQLVRLRRPLPSLVDAFFAGADDVTAPSAASWMRAEAARLLAWAVLLDDAPRLAASRVFAFKDDDALARDGGVLAFVGNDVPMGAWGASTYFVPRQLTDARAACTRNGTALACPALRDTLPSPSRRAKAGAGAGAGAGEGAGAGAGDGGGGGGGDDDASVAAAGAYAALLRTACVFPRAMASTLLEFGTAGALSEAVEARLHDELFDLRPPLGWRGLEERAAWLRATISACIEEHGEDAVLIDADLR